MFIRNNKVFCIVLYCIVNGSLTTTLSYPDQIMDLWVGLYRPSHGKCIAQFACGRYML